jgi:hypothetical protein
MPNDQTRNRNQEDAPPSNAAFHHVPGDLKETENAAARANRLSDPSLPHPRSAAAEPDRSRAAGEAPPVHDETGPRPRRDDAEPRTDEGNLRDAPDTWTTKGNPLA